MSSIHIRTLLAIGVTLALAGCAATTGRAVVGEKFYVYKNEQGAEVLGREWQKPGAKSAAVTNYAADEEFWQFDARINEGMIFNVIGSKAQCETVRNRTPHLTSLSDPCQGPFYFKREK